MALKDTVASVRREQGITQEQMARDLYVTRQAVSRWETGETEPGIDMVKLMAVTYGVPLERFFEMPPEYFCQCCGMPMPDASLHGTEADGSVSADYCAHCYQEGHFTAPDEDLDAFVEGIAPYFEESVGGSRDEAVSFLATVLPQLKRWRAQD